MFHQKHTQMPGKGRTTRTSSASRCTRTSWPRPGRSSSSPSARWPCRRVAQINPIWLYGPYNPVAISAGSQPDFYMGFLEGALRIFPNWAWDAWGHTFAWNVLIPALVPLGAPVHRRRALAVPRTLDYRGQARASRQRPAAQRGHPDRHRCRRHHLVRGLVAGRRERRHRRPLQHLAVPHHGDRPVRGVHRPGDRVHPD